MRPHFSRGFVVVGILTLCSAVAFANPPKAERDAPRSKSKSGAQRVDSRPVSDDADRESGPATEYPRDLVFDDIPLEKLLELSIAGSIQLPLPPADYYGPSYFPHGAYCGQNPWQGSYSHAIPYIVAQQDLRDSARRLYHTRDMRQRAERAVAKSVQAMDAGVARMKAGDYARAVPALVLAAKLNQADPACRVHLAQVRLVQGHYADAGKLLRRALELQPALVFTDMKLDDHYEHIGTLRSVEREMGKWIGDHADELNADTWFARGFVCYQLGEFDAAYQAFAAVDEQRSKCKLTREYLTICRPPATISKREQEAAKAVATRP
ncbi:MAG: tetratricopeptide repeat protein [Phycisphaerae bacterium]